MHMAQDYSLPSQYGCKVNFTHELVLTGIDTVHVEMIDIHFNIVLFSVKHTTIGSLFYMSPFDFGTATSMSLRF